MSSSAVCTLFEGDFHLGVGALANALCRRGFGGTLWAGHRGPLPSWAQHLQAAGGNLPGQPGLHPKIRFLPVESSDHLTNFKPAFMTWLWETKCPEAPALFYFDPDIVVKCDWAFFDEWITYGVALCEDVNSPVLHSHPKRLAWQRIMGASGSDLRRVTEAYVNGGCVGVPTAERGFLAEWTRALEVIRQEVGSLETLAVDRRQNGHRALHPFDKTDQDALNIAVMMHAGAVSIIGKEGMEFAPGGWTLSHAVGSPKPWRKNYLAEALCGRPPSAADKAFWAHVDSPIRLFSAALLRRKKSLLCISAGLGRFYRRTGN